MLEIVHVSDGSSTYHTGNAERTTSNDVLLQPDTLPQNTHTQQLNNIQKRVLPLCC